jgi:ankyrin repeat protein
MVRVAVVQDVLGSTALHRAAGSGHVDAVKALLAAGANVTATDVRGDVAMCWWQALEMLVCLWSGQEPWSHGV